RSSGSEIAVNASRSTGPANSASGWKRLAMLAQSRRGIRRTMISVSRRVGSFQSSRNRPPRTPSRTPAAALFGLKPAATTTCVSITTPPTRPPQVQFYCGNCRRKSLAELVDLPLPETPISTSTIGGTVLWGHVVAATLCRDALHLSAHPVRPSTLLYVSLARG